MRGKAIFTAMKKLLFLGACLVALASQPALAQTGGADVVVVRFSYEGTARVHAFITRGAGKTEVQQLKGSTSEENEFCQQVIAKLYQEGYSLKSTFSAGGVPPNNLVFTKEK
jgi:hypothetical protein